MCVCVCVYATYIKFCWGETSLPKMLTKETCNWPSCCCNHYLDEGRLDVPLTKNLHCTLCSDYRQLPASAKC